MSQLNIVLELNTSFYSYQLAQEIIEYLNIRHPTLHHYIKKENDFKYIILFKVKKDKEIIIRI
jgi:hypothetical protein